MLKKTLLLLLSLFSQTYSFAVSDTTHFSAFIKNYNKNYSDDQLVTRLAIFRDNVNKINLHNSQNHSWKMAINKFADLTPEDFKGAHVCYNHDNLYNNRIRLENLQINVSTLPTEIDWTEKGVVTPVSDQAQCGSCYAFSAVEAVESAYAIATGNLVALSKQQIVDCSGSYGNQGCGGGLMDYCFDYIKDNGICKESDYKYKGVAGTCKKCTSVTTVDSYVDVSPNNESALFQAVSLQPVSVAIEADQSSFQFYSSGILTASCGTNLDHGVLVVGYGTINNQDYWKVKNSWGSSWGQDGYILLERNVKSSSGQCGIAMEPSYPVLSSRIIF